MIETPVLERVLSEALRNGGEFAEVFAEDRSNSSAVLDDGRVEELASGRERGAGIRVVSGETTGFAHTADLSEEGCCGRRRRPPPWPAVAGGGARTVARRVDRAAVGHRAEATPTDHRRARRTPSSCCSVPTRPPGRPATGSPRSRPGSGPRPGGC